MRPVQAFVGFGANLGDRWATIQRASALLGKLPGIGWVIFSPVFESDPVGVLDQPLFLNLVAGLETTLTPEELLVGLQEIERQLGRKRLLRWGPRTIDLDLLLFAGETRSGPELELPHPRMFDRSFVVEPLRLLLERDPFQNEAWADLRRRLSDLPGDPTLRSWRLS
jgi:2-amino-4-hydroxy-6-hydroxymethyldihydropteridine diphosphokinase